MNDLALVASPSIDNVAAPPGVRDEQRRIVDNLRRTLQRRTAVRMIETHISYVLLTGERAYKIKKAVALGFLDFSTLEARRFFCEEELRLNRRLAPMLYTRVVAITGSAEAPHIDGVGAPLEYAVEMREFAQEALLLSMLERGGLEPHHIDTLASQIAQFHRRIETASVSSPYGRPEQILGQAMDNVTLLQGLLLSDSRDRNCLCAIDRWTRHEHAARKVEFDARREAGCVRECHGDLHLGNIVLLGGNVVPFDCIEFSETLRWVDTASEIAFTVMHLHARGHPRLAHRLLNAYLETTGDYGALTVLRFYIVYRAMVRAKIAAIRAAQANDASGQRLAQHECSHYLRLALHSTFATHGALILTHGFSGSGKTTYTQPLLEHLGAVRIRSDVERKRIHSIQALQRTGSDVGGGIYTGDSTAATYDALSALASKVMDAGYPVIVDATFLLHAQRARFAELAATRGVPFVILTFDAPVDVLRQRVAWREERGRDASEATAAVLDHQLRTHEPLTAHERPYEIRFDAATPAELASLRATWHDVIRALHRHPAQPPAARASPASR